MKNVSYSVLFLMALISAAVFVWVPNESGLLWLLRLALLLFLCSLLAFGVKYLGAKVIDLKHEQAATHQNVLTSGYQFEAIYNWVRSVQANEDEHDESATLLANVLYRVLHNVEGTALPAESVATIGDEDDGLIAQLDALQDLEPKVEAACNDLAAELVQVAAQRDGVVGPKLIEKAQAFLAQHTALAAAQKALRALAAS